MKLYGDWWRPQIRIEPASGDDPLIEVYNQAEDPEDAPCTSVRVYFAREQVDVLYTAKGCIEMCTFMNKSTPNDYKENEIRHMHICSMPHHIALLQRAEEIAEEHWRPI